MTTGNSLLACLLAISLGSKRFHLRDLALLIPFSCPASLRGTQEPSAINQLLHPRWPSMPCHRQAAHRSH